MQGWLKALNPKAPELVEFPRCNNASIEWNEKMPADPPLEDPKCEKALEPPEGKDDTWKHLILGQIMSLHI